jgi:large subunit ribosomal protein L25
MKRETLEAFERKELKKGASRRLRREGKIPAVMYGKDQNRTIAIQKNEFERKMQELGENTIIVLTLDDGEHEVLVKDFQEDTIRSFVTHVDFYEIEKGKALRTHVPVEVTGTPAGVLEGGVLEERLYEIEVECKPKDIPEKIEINVENMQIGDTIHVEELSVPEGVTILNYPEQVVVTVTTISEVEEPEVEEEEGLEGEEGEEFEGEEGEEAEGEEGEEAEESEE